MNNACLSAMATQADDISLHHRSGAPPVSAVWEDVELQTLKTQLEATAEVTSKDAAHLSLSTGHEEDGGDSVVRSISCK